LNILSISEGLERSAPENNTSTAPRAIKSAEILFTSDSEAKPFITNFAPFFANFEAIPKPIPLVHPVITTTLSFILFSTFYI
jgi:hypothetical protein